jgi:FdhD protein
MSMRQSKPVISPDVLSTFSACKLVFADYSQTQAHAQIATETPVNIMYGGMPYAVMMATPADLEDYIYGFSLTDGVIKTAADIRDITFAQTGHDITADVSLAPNRFQAHLAKRRTMMGRTSCGLCGLETSAELPQADKVKAHHVPVSSEAIFNAMSQLDRHQPLNRLTRSVHGAAWCGRNGTILDVREDVGRHNALDKIIGSLLRKGVQPDQGFLTITSRASFEMVEKAAIFGAHTIVAISAPTSLAIQRAKALGVSLVAIARHDTALKFTCGGDNEGEGDSHHE